ncbi:MAG: hypothetical protein ACOY6K_12465 [Pseudomonadota bacterium]
MTIATALIALAAFALFAAGILHEARAQERADADEPATSETR